jgi:tripartite-type tricarboxylate transporter receptor subunit TctC
MPMLRRQVLKGMSAVALGGAALPLAGGGPALAAWPERPITMVVPWAAGGGTDATARIIASLLEKELGQPSTS